MPRRYLLLLWVLLIPIFTVKAVSAAEVEFHNDGPLKELGLPFSESVRAGDLLFLADISEWAAFNEVYMKHFTAPYPARSALGANGLALNARAEVECIAAY